MHGLPWSLCILALRRGVPGGRLPPGSQSCGIKGAAVKQMAGIASGKGTGGGQLLSRKGNRSRGAEDPEIRDRFE